MQITLYKLLLVNNHIVTQVIETKLVICNICNVAVISGTSCIVFITV